MEFFKTPPIFLVFGPGFEQQGGQKAEEDGGRHTACRGRGSPDKSPQQAVLLYRLPRSFCQGIAKAGEGNGGACSRPIYQVLLEAGAT